MRALTLLLVVAFVAAVFALMVGDALGGGAWPGWDEGWAVVAFPLGVPAALAAGLAAAGAARVARLTAAGTLAVWSWGALVFALWHAVG